MKTNQYWTVYVLLNIVYYLLVSLGLFSEFQSLNVHSYTVFLPGAGEMNISASLLPVLLSIVTSEMRICLFFFFSPVVWHHGVDSDCGDRVFSRSCSLLGDVCSHLVLGSDHFPVYYLPHWGPQEDAMCPMEYSGNKHTQISLSSILWDSSGLESEPQPKTQKPDTILNHLNPHTKPSNVP